jgi:hypothetical protein
MLEVTMNSIRALNIRDRIETIPWRNSNQEAYIGAPGTRIASAKPTAQPVTGEAATALSSRPASAPSKPDHDRGA